MNQVRLLGYPDIEGKLSPVLNTYIECPACGNTEHVQWKDYPESLSVSPTENKESRFYHLTSFCDNCGSEWVEVAVPVGLYFIKTPHEKNKHG